RSRSASPRARSCTTSARPRRTATGSGIRRDCCAIAVSLSQSHNGRASPAHPALFRSEQSTQGRPRALKLKAALLLVASTLVQVAYPPLVYAEVASLPSCPAQMLIHNNGNVLFDGKTFTGQVQL